MTAAELFEVVKDVPREAWPSMLRNHSTFDPDEPERFWIIYGPMGGDDKRCVHITADIAELAFIGSMTAFKARQFETVVYNREGTTKHIVSQGVTEWEGDSIVAALAAACKEAA